MHKVFITCKESKIETNRSFYGCYQIGPFSDVQGLTIANALRRTLLSDCPGLGITSVTIANAKHEYSTLTGVRESVLDILLNIKDIVLKKKSFGLCLSKGSSPYKKDGLSSIYEQVGTTYFKPTIGYLKVKGPGIIRAKDLRLPPFIECVDPEQYIATLADDGFLCMKFVIMEGKGYLIQNKNSQRRTPDITQVYNRQKLLNDLLELGISREGLGEIPPELLNPLALSNSEMSLGSFGVENAVDKRTHFVSLYEKKRRSSLTAKEKEKKSIFKKRETFEKGSSISRREKGGNTKFNLSANEHKNLKEQSLFQITPVAASSEDSEPLPFGNANPLNIDTLFSPVTKVNYIVEPNANFLVDSLHTKTNLINEIVSLIESSEYISHNFPKLNLFSTIRESAKKGENQSEKEPGSSLASKARNDKAGTGTKVMKEIYKILDTYSTSEIYNLANSLNPVKKASTPTTISLEIWTNGSLHPSEALLIGLKNLTTAFLHLNKTKQMKTLYTNEVTYKNVALKNAKLDKEKE